MLAENPADRHFEYMQVIRHWHDGSEKYAGGDCLLTALYNGFEPDGSVYREEHWKSGARCVVVYYFELSRRGEKMVMPVISNPFVERFIDNYPLRLAPIEQSRSARAAK